MRNVQCYIFALMALALTTLSACKPNVIQITPPEPSPWVMTTSSKRLAVGIIDSRDVDEKAVTSGLISADLAVNEEPVETMRFLKSQISAELTARGFQPVIDSQAPTRLHIHQLELYSTREGSYAPFTVWAALKGELIDKTGKRPLHALVVKEHYPKFIYSELDQPLFSAALDLLIKETTSKLITYTRAGKVNDQTIDEATDSLLQLNGKPDVQQIYALGFSGNPRAASTLMELVQSKELSVRVAAIYGLGVLQTSEYLPTLTALYLKSSNTIEKNTLLKSILDMDKEQSRQWVASQVEDLKKPDVQDPLGLLKKTLELYDIEI